MWAYLILTVLMGVGFLLMFVILLQRGRGGGLAGAFGGMGGQSAFGTKAGDVFTRITVCLAVVWVVLAAASGFVLRDQAEKSRLFPGGQKVGPSEPQVRDAKPEDGATPNVPLAPEKPTEPEKAEGESTPGAAEKPESSEKPEGQGDAKPPTANSDGEQ